MGDLMGLGDTPILPIPEDRQRIFLWTPFS